jgi:hypothetical protein
VAAALIACFWLDEGEMILSTSWELKLLNAGFFHEKHALHLVILEHLH